MNTPRRRRRFRVWRLLEHDSDRPVVDELDRHPGAEHSGLDADAQVAERRSEGLVEPLRLLGRGRLGKARAIALRRIRDQRELADDERLAARVEEAAVEPAV